MAHRSLPAGRVTFAFVDVVGSTRAFAEHGPRYVEAVHRVHDVIERHVVDAGGVVVEREGDGAFVAFSDATAAVAALSALQADLERSPAEDHLPHLRVRAGAHTGDAEPAGDRYLALPVHVAARVTSTANAGQLIVSETTAEHLGRAAGERLGDYSLKDIAEPMTLWRVMGDATPPRAEPALRTNIVRPRTSFRSRDAELQKLADANTQGPLVTVVGTGGIGKSRLVTEHGLRVLDSSPAGVWLAELAGVTHEGDLVSAIAGTVGAAGVENVPGLVDVLADRGPVTLILDNCEHLLDGVAELVVEILRGAPAARVICTSREPLDVPGEVILPLGPLRAAQTAGQLGAAEQLFIERAAQAGAEVAGSPALTELCGLLDGLPLAIELAAAQAMTSTPEELMEELRRGSPMWRRRGGDQRQRSLDAVVRWSVNPLSAEERRSLMALSVFPGRFTRGDAATFLAQVPGADVSAVGALVRRSLVDRDGGDFRLLTTVRTVVSADLLTDPQLPSVRRALISWAASTNGNTREEDLKLPADQVRALEVATEWAMDDAHELAGQLLGRIVVVQLGAGVTESGRLLAQKALSLPSRDDADYVRMVLAAHRILEGLYSEGRSTTPDDAYRILEMARRAGDPDVIRKALAWASAKVSKAGRHDEALRLTQEALELGERSGASAEEQGICLLDLGAATHRAGDLDGALEFYGRSLQMLPEGMNAGLARFNIAEALIEAGRWQAAADHVEEALVIGTANLPLRILFLMLLTEAQARLGHRVQATQIAAQVERDFPTTFKNDDSVAEFLDRMREALASMPPDP